jgi:hypothetical protein
MIIIYYIYILASGDYPNKGTDKTKYQFVRRFTIFDRIGAIEGFTFD